MRVDLPRPRDHATRRFTEIKTAISIRCWASGRNDRRVHALAPAHAVVGYDRLVRTA